MEILDQGNELYQNISLTNKSYEKSTNEGTKKGKYTLRTKESKTALYLYPKGTEIFESEPMNLEWLDDANSKSILIGNFPPRFQDCVEYVMPNEISFNNNIKSEYPLQMEVLFNNSADRPPSAKVCNLPT